MYVRQHNGCDWAAAGVLEVRCASGNVMERQNECRYTFLSEACGKPALIVFCLLGIQPPHYINLNTKREKRLAAHGSQIQRRPPIRLLGELTPQQSSRTGSQSPSTFLFVFCFCTLQVRTSANVAKPRHN